MNRKPQGFTLIELLIVIAIIGVLAAILIPNLLGAQKRAIDVTTKTFLQDLNRHEGLYYVDYGQYFDWTNPPSPMPAYLAELYNDVRPGGKYDGIIQSVQVTAGGQAYCAFAKSSRGVATGFNITSTNGVQPGACS